MLTLVLQKQKPSKNVTKAARQCIDEAYGP